MTPVPERLIPEQQAVEATIRSAFRGVNRVGGVSWTQAIVIDGIPSFTLTEEEARAKDTERCWEDLVDDPAWIHEVGIGGFSFLDAVGYQYYVAPAMIRCAREGHGELVAYALTIESDYQRSRVTLFTPGQSHAVARFIRFMIAVHAAEGDEIYGKQWSFAYCSHWRRYDRGTPLSAH